MMISASDTLARGARLKGCFCLLLMIAVFVLSSSTTVRASLPPPPPTITKTVDIDLADAKVDIPYAARLADELVLSLSDEVNVELFPKDAKQHEDEKICKLPHDNGKVIINRRASSTPLACRQVLLGDTAYWLRYEVKSKVHYVELRPATKVDETKKHEVDTLDNLEIAPGPVRFTYNMGTPTKPEYRSFVSTNGKIGTEPGDQQFLRVRFENENDKQIDLYVYLGSTNEKVILYEVKAKPKGTTPESCKPDAYYLDEIEGDKLLKACERIDEEGLRAEARYYQVCVDMTRIDTHRVVVVDVTREKDKGLSSAERKVIKTQKEDLESKLEIARVNALNANMAAYTAAEAFIRISGDARATTEQKKAAEADKRDAEIEKQRAEGAKQRIVEQLVALEKQVMIRSTQQHTGDLIAGRPIFGRIFHPKGTQVEFKVRGSDKFPSGVFIDEALSGTSGSSEGKVGSVDQAAVTEGCKRTEIAAWDTDSPVYRVDELITIDAKVKKPKARAKADDPVEYESVRSIPYVLRNTPLYRGAVRVGIAGVYAPLDRQYTLRSQANPTANPGKEIALDSGFYAGAELMLGYSHYLAGLSGHKLQVPGNWDKVWFAWYFGVGLVGIGPDTTTLGTSLVMGPELSINHSWSIALTGGLRRTQKLKDGYALGDAVATGESDPPLTNPWRPTLQVGLVINFSPKVFQIVANTRKLLQND